MPSTRILCKGSFKCKNWLNGIPSVGGLAGWSREGKILIWVDNGNTWTRSKGGEMLDHAAILEDYRQVAMLIPHVWETYIYFISRTEGDSRLVRDVGPLRSCASRVNNGYHSFAVPHQVMIDQFLNKPSSQCEIRRIVRSVSFWLYGRDSRSQ